MNAFQRQAAERLDWLLAHFPAVALIGPRQCGKTTLALSLCARLGDRALYLDLERTEDLVRLSDPDAYLSGQTGRLVVLDEVHRLPSLFPILRGLIDRRRRAGERVGQFLLLGSASLDLVKHSGESLAGRIAHLELTPFLASELPNVGLDRLWLRGGFPESTLAASDRASLEWRLAFIRSYLERDIPQLGPRIPAETLRRLWTMLAHEQGGMLNAARLAGSLGVSGQTIARYLDLMVDLLLVRRLPPWAGNVGKRLVKSPKVYVRDSGIAHALLGIADQDALLGHPVQGGSWEGLVVEHLLARLPATGHGFFYRTAAGGEIDLVLDLPPAERWAIEIKRSLAPALRKGFHIGATDVAATKRWVVYPGSETFPLDRETTAIPLTALMAQLDSLTS